MAAPTINSAVLDKPTYRPGETARLTITYSDVDNQTFTGTVTITDQTGAAGTATFTLVVTDPTTITVTDNGGHVWTKLSDTGSVAVFSVTL